MPFLKTLRFKVSLLFLSIMLLLEIALLYYNFYAIRTVRNQVAESYMKLLPSIVVKMDDSLGEVRDYLIGTINLNSDNADIVSFDLSLKGSTEYYYSMSNISRKFSKDINYFGMVVDSLFVYSQHNDELVSYTAAFTDSKRDYEKINRGLIGLSRMAAEKGTDSLWKVDMTGDEPGLVCIIGNSAGCFIGAKIDIKRFLVKYSTEENEKIGAVITDRDRKILFSTNTGIPGKTIIARYGNLREAGFETVSVPENSDRYLVIAQPANNAGIVYAQLINEQVLTKNFDFFKIMIVILPVSLLVIMLVYFAFLQGILIKPLKELVKGMKRIMRGELEVRIDDRGPEEFRLVINTFNSMVSQIHKLKIDIYEGELKAKNAELKAANSDLKAANAELEARESELRSMQMQINPHFFANSLNIVYNLAALKDIKAVQKMSIYLSNYFRYLLQIGNSMTELRREMDFIHNYLGIQKIRFTMRLESEISVPEQYMTQKLPPLLLQPFVENSIVHGFKDNGQTLRIRISAEPDPEFPDKSYIIRIQDNGRGFSDENISILSDQERDESGGGKHIGIRNIMNRLNITFGDTAKLLLGNGEDGGAIVKLWLPINTGKSGEDGDGNV